MNKQRVTLHVIKTPDGDYLCKTEAGAFRVVRDNPCATYAGPWHTTIDRIPHGIRKHFFGV